MRTYHKIQTVFKRDPDNHFKTLLEGQYSEPEFEYLKDNDWVWTEKVDGTNVRVQYHDGNVYFKGKTDRAQMPPQLLENLQEMFPVERMKSTFTGSNVCLYGEGYGAKIQKAGASYGPEQTFVLFDIRAGEWWLQRKDLEGIAKNLGIDIVPIVEVGPLSEMVVAAEQGCKSQWGDFLMEGFVARPATELKTRAGGRIITKIKTADFGG